MKHFVCCTSDCDAACSERDQSDTQQLDPSLRCMFGWAEVYQSRGGCSHPQSNMSVNDWKASERDRFNTQVQPEHLSKVLVTVVCCIGHAHWPSSHSCSHCFEDACNRLHFCTPLAPTEHGSQTWIELKAPGVIGRPKQAVHYTACCAGASTTASHCKQPLQSHCKPPRQSQTRPPPWLGAMPAAATGGLCGGRTVWRRQGTSTPSG